MNFCWNFPFWPETLLKSLIEEPPSCIDLINIFFVFETIFATSCLESLLAFFLGSMNLKKNLVYVNISKPAIYF